MKLKTMIIGVITAGLYIQAFGQPFPVPGGSITLSNILAAGGLTTYYTNILNRGVIITNPASGTSWTILTNGTLTGSSNTEVQISHYGIYTDQNDSFGMYDLNNPNDIHINFGFQNGIEIKAGGGSFDIGGGVDGLPSMYNANGDGIVILNDSTIIFSATPNFGALTWNANGATNIPSTHIVFALSTSNLVVGTTYSNSYGGALGVSGLAVKGVEAAVAGQSALVLGIEGVSTNVIYCQLTAVGLLTTGSSTNPIESFIIPANARWKFTDVSSGAGNSAAGFGGIPQFLLY